MQLYTLTCATCGQQHESKDSGFNWLSPCCRSRPRQLRGSSIVCSESSSPMSETDIVTLNRSRINPEAIKDNRIACEYCAKAKTKCDKNIPSCAKCIEKKQPCFPRLKKSKKSRGSPKTPSKRFNSNAAGPYGSRRNMYDLPHIPSIPPGTPVESLRPQAVALIQNQADGPGTHLQSMAFQVPSSFTQHPIVMAQDGTDFYPYNQYTMNETSPLDAPHGLPITWTCSSEQSMFDNHHDQLSCIPLETIPGPLGQAYDMNITFQDMDAGSWPEDNHWTSSPGEISSSTLTPGLEFKASPAPSESYFMSQNHESKGFPPTGLNEPPSSSSCPEASGDLPWVSCNLVMEHDGSESTPSWTTARLQEALQTLNQWSSAYTDTSSPIQSNIFPVGLVFFDEQDRHVLAMHLEDLSAKVPMLQLNNAADGLKLPSPGLLMEFARAYASRSEPFQSVLPVSSPIASEILSTYDREMDFGRPDWPKLFLLLVIAAGALSVGTETSSQVAHEIMHCCQLAMHEDRIMVSSDAMRLRTVLLFLSVALWSGDTDLTNYAKMHYKKYMEKMKDSRFLINLGQNNPPPNGKLSLRQWQKQEACNRLAYCIACTDAVVCLFEDDEPTFRTADFQANFPAPEEIWSLGTEDQWMAAQPYLLAYQPNTNLKDLSEKFNRDQDLSGVNFTPLQLRMLLFSCQGYVASIKDPLNNPRTLTPANEKRLRNDLETARTRLVRWHHLAIFFRPESNEGPDHALWLSTMIMYHLVMLNVFVNFPDMETFARGDSDERVIRKTWWGLHLPRATPAVMYHCGQVIQLYRLVPAAFRPLWLPLALYRVAITLWATSYLNGSHGLPAVHTDASMGNIFCLDDLHIDIRNVSDPFTRYWFYQDDQYSQIGTPTLLPPNPLLEGQRASLNAAEAYLIPAHIALVIMLHDSNSVLGQKLAGSLDAFHQRLCSPFTKEEDAFTEDNNVKEESMDYEFNSRL